jgi:hypothetical protein
VERHATRFGSYFAAALDDPTADIDKNQIISAAEAFSFAERQVDDYFERNGQLATEHPRLEGERADRFGLARLGAPRLATDDRVLNELIEDRFPASGTGKPPACGLPLSFVAEHDRTCKDRRSDRNAPEGTGH